MTQQQIQIRKGHTANGARKAPRTPQETDTRTPSGKKLPY